MIKKLKNRLCEYAIYIRPKLIFQEYCDQSDAPQLDHKCSSRRYRRTVTCCTGLFGTFVCAMAVKVAQLRRRIDMPMKRSRKENPELDSSRQKG